MSKKTTVTAFKTNKITQFTGGKIGDFQIPDYPNPEDGLLTNSFLSQKGVYIGDYDRAWWYYKHKLVVCEDYPAGAAIRLKMYDPEIKLKNSIKDKFESWFCEQWENNNLKGFHGYSHRGGQTFIIGDRLFNEDYEPKEEDYTKGEWKEFTTKRMEAVKKNLKEGYYDTEEEALDDISISSVMPFNKRGGKFIETWVDAKEAAINMSKYLS